VNEPMTEVDRTETASPASGLGVTARAGLRGLGILRIRFRRQRDAAGASLLGNVEDVDGLAE
jgi:hypothetical protein